MSQPIRSARWIAALAAVLGACGAPLSGSGDDVALIRLPIVGGSPDTLARDMAVVAIESGVGALCSGTLVAPRWVMTAAHCVEATSNPRAYQIGFGNDVNRSSMRWVGVAAVYEHPDWDSRNIVNDIALLQLSSDAPAGVVPIPPLPASLALGASAVGTNVQFSGFGLTDPYDPGSTGVKYQVTAPIGLVCGGSNYCSFRGGQASPRTICFNQQPGGACSGDSGGPAFVTIGGTVYVAGVTSYGDENCQYFGCSTKVDAFEAFWGPRVGTGGGSTGGGSTGGGSTGGGSTGGAGACVSGLQCVDVTENGDYACLDSSTQSGIPSGAPTCSSSRPCAAGFNCWRTSSTSASGVCLQDCTPGAAGGGSTGGGSSGGGSTGGGTTGGCASGLQCVDVTESGDYACIDPGSQTGIPSGAPSCSSSRPCAAGFSCWRTSSTSTAGICLQDCAGASSGGSTGGGSTGGGSAGSAGACASGLQCVDVTESGDYACIDPASQTGIPSGAPSCNSTRPCAAGFSCWRTSSTSTSGICLQDCTGASTGDGSTGGGSTGGGSTGGGSTGGGSTGGGSTGGGSAGGGSTGGGSTGSGSTGGGSTGGGSTGTAGACASGLRCIDASGQGDFACVDPNTQSGIPAGAATCNSSRPCAAGFNCWRTSSTSTSGICLQDCSGDVAAGGGTTGGSGAPHDTGSHPGDGGVGTGGTGTTGGTGSVLQGAGGACSTASDCESGLLCVADSSGRSFCNAACAADSDCGEGKTCRKVGGLAVCLAVPPSTEPPANNGDATTGAGGCSSAGLPGTSAMSGLALLVLRRRRSVRI